MAATPCATAGWRPSPAGATGSHSPAHRPGSGSAPVRNAREDSCSTGARRDAAAARPGDWGETCDGSTGLGLARVPLAGRRTAQCRLGRGPAARPATRTRGRRRLPDPAARRTRADRHPRLTDGRTLNGPGPGQDRTETRPEFTPTSHDGDPGDASAA